MKAGEAKLGMHVRVTAHFDNYPSLQGREGTIDEVVAQHEGAEEDALLFRPFDSKLSYPVRSCDVELLREGHQ